MKFLVVLFFPFLTHAEYLLGYGTGSYMGQHQIIIERISENKKHHALGIFGYTGDNELGDIKQVAGAYLYSLEKKDFEDFQWIPLLSGAFITYTDHPKYYVSSPSRYPTDDYYDVTGLRFGFRFSSEIWLVRKNEKTIRFSMDGSLLERSLIAYFNNPSEFEIFQAFWSLGFSVKFEFQ